MPPSPLAPAEGEGSPPTPLLLDTTILNNFGVRAGTITRQEAHRLLREMKRHGYRFPLENLEDLF